MPAALPISFGYLRAGSEPRARRVQPPCTIIQIMQPRETAQIPCDWLVKNGVTMKA